LYKLLHVHTLLAVHLPYPLQLFKAEQSKTTFEQDGPLQPALH